MFIQVQNYTLTIGMIIRFILDWLMARIYGPDITLVE